MMTFDQFLQNQGWQQVTNDDGALEWRMPDGEGGFRKALGSNLDTMQEQYQASGAGAPAGYFTQQGSPYIYNNQWSAVGTPFDQSGQIGTALQPVDAEHAQIAQNNNVGLQTLGGQQYLDINNPGYQSVYPAQQESGFDKILGAVLPTLIAGGMLGGIGSGLTGAGILGTGGGTSSGGNILNSIGGANAGTGAVGAGGGLSAADTLGLQQMAADAGLTGNAASNFVASGGTLGSTAANSLLPNLGTTNSVGTTQTPVANATGATTGSASTVPDVLASNPATSAGAGTAAAADSALGGLGGTATAAADPVTEWASQYGPNAVNADGSLNWDAITQGMDSQQGVVAGTGADFPYDPVTGAIDPSVTSGGGNLPSVPPGSTPSGNGNPTTQNSSQSALARLLGLGQAGSDALSVLGPLLGSALGYAGSQQQANAYRDVANQQAAIGLPYRNQLAASYQPGFDLSSQPGYGDAFGRIADISARSYAAKSGNPAGNPTAQAGILSDVWNQGYLPALTNYRGQLGQFGGLGLNTSGAASLASAGQTGGGYNALGYGLGSITQPQNDVQSLLRQLGGGQNSGMTLSIGGLPYGSR